MFRSLLILNYRYKVWQSITLHFKISRVIAIDCQAYSRLRFQAFLTTLPQKPQCFLFSQKKALLINIFVL